MQFYASPEIVYCLCVTVACTNDVIHDCMNRRLYDIRRMQSNAFKRRVVEEQYTEARSTFMRGVLIVIIFITGPEGGPDPQDPLAGSALAVLTPNLLHSGDEVHFAHARITSVHMTRNSP